MNNTLKDNEKGVTLIELLVAIVIGSVVISMLMSVLVMSLKAKATFDTNSRMLDESYLIVESVQAKILDLGPQEIVIDNTVPNQTIVRFRHVCDIELNEFDVIDCIDLVTPIEDVLIYDEIAGTLTYNSIPLHSSNILINLGSVVELISVDPLALCDFTETLPCDQAILKLSLNISIELNNGGIVDPKIFITTILI